MQAELARMSDDNQRLRGVLSQVTNNYNALQMHLITLMQQRSNNNGSNEVLNCNIFDHFLPYKLDNQMNEITDPSNNQ